MKRIFYAIILFTLIIAFSVLLNSCIEDDITPPLTGDLNPVGEMLYYFEIWRENFHGLLEPGKTFEMFGDYPVLMDQIAGRSKTATQSLKAESYEVVPDLSIHE